MLTKAEALAILMANVPRATSEETVGLEAALGRVLAEDARSDMDMPPFHRSAMDGYAVRAADLTKLPRELDVIETVAAGAVATQAIGSGQAARIMTGAPVPEGADTVIQREWTNESAADRVRVERGGAAGLNISRRGEDTREGEVVLRRGTPLRAQEIGVLSSVGRREVRVLRVPRVAIAATGDELLAPGEGIPGPGQIRESNMSMLVAQTRSLGLGIECTALGITRDRPDAVRAMIERAMEADVLIVSGGVSMGDYDFVPGELKAAGLRVHIEKVAIRPGKPLLFGPLPRPGRAPLQVFGLPGNPVSSFCTFELFVRPFLRAMMGRPAPHILVAGAVVSADVPGRAMDRTQHVPVRVTLGLDGLEAEPIRWHGSGDLRSLLDANAFVVVEKDAAPPKRGQRAEVMIFEPDPFRLPPHRSRELPA